MAAPVPVGVSSPIPGSAAGTAGAGAAPSDDSLGLCPLCAPSERAPIAMRNVGCAHYVYCTQHRVYWFLGVNLFDWRNDGEESWKASTQILGTMRRVLPRYFPDTEHALWLHLRWRPRSGWLAACLARLFRR